MNAVPSKELASRISELLIGVNGVDQLHEVHAHRFGPNGVINVTIGINGALTVEEGDKIASQVERILCENMQGIRKVHVHYHPSDADHQGKTIDEILKESLSNITT
jgi:divalent metal cation (Fe/Co/Zn/Cd) transporter